MTADIMFATLNFSLCCHLYNKSQTYSAVKAKAKTSILGNFYYS